MRIMVKCGDCGGDKAFVWKGRYNDMKALFVKCPCGNKSIFYQPVPGGEVQEIRHAEFL